MSPAGGPGMHLCAYHLPVLPGPPVHIHAECQGHHLVAWADLFMCLPRLISIMCLYLPFPSTHPGQPGYPGLDVGCIPALACCGTGSPSSSTTTWWQKHTSLPAYSALQCYIPCGSVATLVCTPTVSQQPGSKGMPVFHKGCVVW